MSERSHLDRLTAARDQLEALIADSDQRTAPALVREYRAVLDEIEKLSKKGGSGLDDLAARRAQRIAAAKGSDAAAVQE